ncbi:MAG: DUF2634 domain-containing protein [Fusobacterium sp.]
MSIFPENITDVSTENKISQSAEKRGYKDILFDVEKKKIIVKDGNVVIASKKEQIKQWIFLLIHTEIDKYKVYKDTNFGIVFLYEMRGHDFYSSGFTIAQIKDELTEKIQAHQWVEKVENVEVDKGFNNLIITVTVIVDGEEVESEVVYNV